MLEVKFDQRGVILVAEYEGQVFRPLSINILISLFSTAYDDVSGFLSTSSYAQLLIKKTGRGGRCSRIPGLLRGQDCSYGSGPGRIYVPGAI